MRIVRKRNDPGNGDGEVGGAKGVKELSCGA